MNCAPPELPLKSGRTSLATTAPLPALLTLGVGGGSQLNESDLWMTSLPPVLPQLHEDSDVTGSLRL